MSSQSATIIGTWVAARFSALVPDWVRAMFLGYPLARTVYFVSPGEAKGRHKLSQNLLTGTVLPAAKRKGHNRIDVVAPAELFLRRTIRVPQVAGRKLLAAAELDLRQHTPFNPKDVYWQLALPQKQDDTFEVTQWVAKKSDVEKWRARLAQHGLQVRRIFVQGTDIDQPIAEFLGELAPRRRLILTANGVLVVIALGAVLGGWLYPAWAAERQTQSIQGHMQKLQVQAVDLRRQVEAMRGADQERTAFLDGILRRPLLVDTLRALTVAMPDDVWAASLLYSPARVVLNGETDQSAADLVLQLGKRHSLGNPRLSGSVQRTATGAERFELTIDLGKKN